jgi:hypothetical protein
MEFGVISLETARERMNSWREKMNAWREEMRNGENYPGSHNLRLTGFNQARRECALYAYIVETKLRA